MFFIYKTSRKKKDSSKIIYKFKNKLLKNKIKIDLFINNIV